MKHLEIGAFIVLIFKEEKPYEKGIFKNLMG